jgi:uncharacterized protein YndB with AHSA1/START domain
MRSDDNHDDNIHQELDMTTRHSSTPAPAASSDRIEEQVTLAASRSRVWRALTDADELGSWFGMHISGARIAPGAHVKGNFTFPGFEHVVFDAIIEEMVPEKRFAWRWHPHAVEQGVDYSGEPRTLVSFTLEDTVEGGTLLRVVESGFDAIPQSRRSAAFRGNSSGWTSQLQKRLVDYLAAA